MTGIDALDELGRRLEVGLRTRPRRSRRRTALIVAFACAALAAPALAAVTGGFDFHDDLPKPGQPGGPPAPVHGVPRERTIDIIRYAFSGPERIAQLRARLRPYGIGVRFRTHPVVPKAVGRVFGVQLPHRARFQGPRMVLEHGVGGNVIIDIGRRARPGEHATTRGLTLYEVLPQVGRAVDVNDPSATGRRLARLGFTIHWKLVVDNPRGYPPTGSRAVTRPPEGTKIISVLNARGSMRVSPKTRTLTIEVAPVDSKIARSHP